MRRMERGFTLFELSMVLAVVGLITGGVIAGQSMLKNAQNLAVVSELDRYRNAANQFREQYRAWPGDFAGATALWGAAGGTGTGSACFTVSTTTGATCNGNGDEIIKTAAGAISSDTWYYGERFHAWKHLVDAKLIDGRFTGVAGSTNNYAHIAGTNAPKSSLKGYSYTVIHADGSGGRYIRDANDYEYVGNALMMQDDAGGTYITTNLAHFVDSKLDDGLPGTGMIRGDTGCGTTTAKYTAKYDLTDKDRICRLQYYLANDAYQPG